MELALGGSVTYGATTAKYFAIASLVQNYDKVKLGVGREVNFARD